MEIINPRICPKCESSTNTYRHPNAKIWCPKCGFVLKEEGVLWAKKFTQEEIDAANQTVQYIRKSLNEESECQSLFKIENI
jgi:transcription initiation factor TFIIIB Brf1 subunit/transcription initiation factor TFIIB